MNERLIENLSDQAKVDTRNINSESGAYVSQWKKRFAELIVAEGVKIFHTEMFRLDALQGREIQAQSMETAAMMLKKHFGVSE